MMTAKQINRYRGVAHEGPVGRVLGPVQLRVRRLDSAAAVLLM